MKKLHNRGFAAMELILMLLIAAIIGGAGYSVYNAQKDTKKTQEKTKKAQSEQAAQPAQPQDKYLEIKEWGVRFKLSADAKDAYYKLRTEDETADYVDVYNSTFDKFKNVNGDVCKEELLFVVSRNPKGTPGLEDDPYTAGGKVIGNYSYTGLAAHQAPPNCAFLTEAMDDQQDQKVLDEFTKYKKALTESFKSLEATP